VLFGGFQTEHLVVVGGMLLQAWISYGGDTQSRNLYKSTCTRNVTVWHGFLYKIFLVQVSCTEYSTALFHTRNLHAQD